jgi:hypothetical protein
MTTGALLAKLGFLLFLLFIAGHVIWGVYDFVTSRFRRETELTALVDKVRNDLATIEENDPNWKVKDVELEINFSLKHSTEAGTSEKVEVASGKIGTERESGQRLLLKLAPRAEASASPCGCECQETQGPNAAPKPQSKTTPTMSK